MEEARKVAAENGLHWLGADSKDLHFEGNVYSDKFNAILNENIFPPSAKFALRTQFWNLNLFGAENAYIHIHSNCAEAGRGRVSTTDALGEYPFYAGSYSFEAFFESYINSAAAWQDADAAEKQKQSMRHCSVLKELLSDYFAMLGHREVAELGYNPWDFMYIEQRTASVLSQSHMPNDGAFESLSLTNSRDILQILWSVPEQFINGSCLLFNCILNEFDPVFRARSVGGHFQGKGTPAERGNYALLYGGDILCGKLKEEEQRMALAERALRIDPTVQWPYLKLINGYLRRNRPEDALRWARKMIRAVPELCRLACCDAVCNELRKSGRAKDALAFIREVLAADSKTGWAYKHWASLCWAEKKYSEALALAEKGYSCDGENRWVVQTYVTMLINRGQYDRAYGLLQKHAERFSAQEWPYFCMARICKAQGEREKALAYAEKAAALKPDSAEIRRWIAELNRG